MGGRKLRLQLIRAKPNTGNSPRSYAKQTVCIAHFSPMSRVFPSALKYSLRCCFFFFWKNPASFMLYKNVCACRPNNQSACCWAGEWRTLVHVTVQWVHTSRTYAGPELLLPPGAQHIPFQLHCKPWTLRSFLPPEGGLALKEWVRCSGSAAAASDKGFRECLCCHVLSMTHVMLSQDFGFCSRAAPELALVEAPSARCGLWSHLAILSFRFWKCDRQRLTRGPRSYGAKRQVLLQLRRRKRKMGNDLSCVRNSVPFWSILHNFVTSF